MSIYMNIYHIDEIYSYISYTHVGMQQCTCDRIYIYIYKDTQHTCISSPQK